MANYDIVREYDWTSVPRNSPLREEAPVAICTAHILENNQLQQFLGGYINTLESIDAPGGADKGLLFYRNLYKTTGDKKGTFFFPFFTDDYRSFSNDYDNSFSSISQRGADMIGAEVIENLAGAGEKIIGGGIELGKNLASIGGGVAAAFATKDSEGKAQDAKGMSSEGLGAVMRKAGSAIGGTVTMGAPGTYIETPKFYQYANTDTALQLSFALSNTLNDDAAEKNADFIKFFTTINRPERKSSIGMTFPAIYHIEVPGLRYIEWASLENFGVSMLGQRRRIGGVIIPEGYIITLTFKSLTIEAANFMKMVKTPSQSGAQYEYERSQALADLRSQAETTGGAFSQFTQMGNNMAADLAEAQQNAALRESGGIPSN
jgi:hypothetical protein